MRHALILALFINNFIDSVQVNCHLNVQRTHQMQLVAISFENGLNLASWCHEEPAKKGLVPNEIHADKVTILGDDTPALSTVKMWLAVYSR